MREGATGMICKESLYGSCGIYCGACRADDCGGCLVRQKEDTVNGCKFRQCADRKEVEFCCFCDEYPCQGLAEFMNDKWPHHHTIEANLNCIKSGGKEAWLKLQKQQWTCADCGGQIYWYQKTCKCGHKLDAWDLPANEQ